MDRDIDFRSDDLRSESDVSAWLLSISTANAALMASDVLGVGKCHTIGEIYLRGFAQRRSEDSVHWDTVDEVGTSRW